MDVDAREPKAVADTIFKFYMKNYRRLFKGYNDQNAYAAVGVYYDAKERAVSFSFAEVAGSSQTWVNAWNQAK